MYKKRLKFPLFLLIGVSFALSSCSNTTIVDDNGDDNDDQEPSEPINENEDLTVPEQSDVSQIYLKRALTNFTIGQTIDLKNYIGVLPGKNEDASLTDFTSSILKVADEPDVATLAENNLSFIKEGSFYLGIRANGQARVFEISVSQSVPYSNLINFLGSVDKNYTVNFYGTDEYGAEVITNQTLRSANYFYNSSAKYGYILSNKDNNIYTYGLSDVNSTDLTINTPPIGDNYDYNNLFYSISDFANPLYWTFTNSMNNQSDLSGYNYVLNYSTSLASRFCAALFLTTNLSYGGLTYYPYTVYARVTNDEIRFVPFYMSLSGTSIIYLSPCSITNVGTTSVGVLDEYVENNEAPEKVDTSEVINNIRYASNLMNYTFSTTMSVKDENGDNVSATSAVYQDYFAKFANALNQRKVMPNGYWSSNFSGSNGEIIPGGLLCTNNKTYLYRNVNNTPNVEDYTLISEYIEEGQTSSYPYWYSYSNMFEYLLSGAFSYNEIFNGYPTKDGDDYIFSSNSEEGLDLVTGALAFGCQPFSANSGILHQALGVSNSTLRFHFEYDESGTLEEMVLTTTMTLDSSLEPRIDQNYVMQFVTTVSDIGTTDFSDILEHVNAQLVGGLL